MPSAQPEPTALPSSADRARAEDVSGSEILSPSIGGEGPAIDLQRLLAQRILATPEASGPTSGSPAEALALDLVATRADVDYLEWLIASTSRAAGPILLAVAVAGLVMLLI